MHDQATVDRFIELRARDWSLRRISREINVPTSTLSEWDSKASWNIVQARNCNREELQESLRAAARRHASRIARWLNRLDAEFSKRLQSPQSLSNVELFKMASSLRAELSGLRSQVYDASCLAELDIDTEPDEPPPNEKPDSPVSQIP